MANGTEHRRRRPFRVDWGAVRAERVADKSGATILSQRQPATTILKQVFGTDDIPFTTCSTTVGPGRTCGDATPAIRSYSSFTEAADENGVSRIYVGIHFRRAVAEGVQHGRQIAAYTVHQLLKPVY